MKKLFAVSVSLLCLLFFASCSTMDDLFSGKDIPKNNNVPIEELVRHILTKTNAEPLCDMEPGPVHADSGFSVMLAGKQVAFYKYDASKKKMRKKLEMIRKSGCVYIVGRKFPAMVNGSFVMVDYEVNPEKDKLIRVFKDF